MVNRSKYFWLNDNVLVHESGAYCEGRDLSYCILHLPSAWLYYKCPKNKARVHFRTRLAQAYCKWGLWVTKYGNKTKEKCSVKPKQKFTRLWKPAYITVRKLNWSICAPGNPLISGFAAKKHQRHTFFAACRFRKDWMVQAGMYLQAPFKTPPKRGACTIFSGGWQSCGPPYDNSVW